MMKGVGLVVGVTGDISGLKGAMGDAGKEVKGLGGISAGSALKVAAVGGAITIAAAAAFEMAKAADADRTEQKKLTAAIEAAGAATGNYQVLVDEAIAQGQDKAFSDSETRAGLESLVRATGDVSSATGLLAGAQDIARASGVSLEQASDAIAKAHLGNDGALRKLMPGLAKGATGMDTIANATKAAAGQAQIFAESGEGAAMKTADAMGELGEEIGSALLPVFDALLPALVPIIKQFGILVKALLPILIPLVQALARWFTFFAGVLGKVIGFVIDLVNWISDLLDTIGDALDALSKLNPFGGVIDAVTGGGGMSLDTGGTGGTLNATFNVYGDPAVIERTVVNTLRDYSRRNGYETLGLASRQR